MPKTTLLAWWVAGGLLVTASLSARRIRLLRCLAKVLGLFGSDTLIVQRPYSTYSKMKVILKDGFKKCALITDFDHTMTPFSVGGNECAQCHGVIEKSPLMIKSKGFKEDMEQIWKDVSTAKTGTWSVGEWWERVHKVICIHGMRQSYVQAMVEESNIELRPGILDIFHLCKRHGIPVAIISAGIRNFIMKVLKDEKIEFPGNAVLSNEMIWGAGKDPFIKTFSQPTVHPDTKGSVRVLNERFFDIHSQRLNVIVMGDSFSDVKAAENIVSANALFIGFVNKPHADGTYGWRHSPLEQYGKVYDVLVPSDGSALPVHCFINRIGTEC